MTLAGSPPIVARAGHRRAGERRMEPEGKPDQDATLLLEFPDRSETGGAKRIRSRFPFEGNPGSIPAGTATRRAPGTGASS